MVDFTGVLNAFFLVSFCWLFLWRWGRLGGSWGCLHLFLIFHLFFCFLLVGVGACESIFFPFSD